MSKILLVDDSQDLLEAMEFFLKKKGYQVKTAFTKENIINEVKEFSPDLVFLDVFMHGMDGRQLCLELRKIIETKYLYIILFSSSPTALENHSQYGADGSLEKPFGLNNLVEKIENVLQGSKDNVVN